MNKKEILTETLKDCIKLKKQKQLTEFGEGQMVLCKLMLGKLR